MARQALKESAKVSRYEILGEIATGGMATVFVGRARGAASFSRLVALKRPHPFVMADASLRKHLEHEARVASMIHHTHVVSVLDVEIVGNEMLMVLDYVEGGTLSELVKRGDVPHAIALRVVLDVASGLHAAHVLEDSAGEPLGIVHRDVSPQNILVGLDGVARITDFGIAKIATEHEHTATNVLKGKLAYLPPEYIERRAFDARSDAYALAVVAWEALARKRLFRGANEIETLKLVTERGPLPLSDVVPELGAISDVLARAMARIPNDRYESVAAFADALRGTGATIATHEEVAAYVDGVLGESVRARRREVEAFPVSKAGSARDAMATVSVASDGASEKKSPRTKWLAIGAIGVVAATGIAFGARALVRETPRAETSATASTAPSSAPTETTSAAPAIPSPTQTATATATATATHAPVRPRSRPTATSSMLRRAPPNPYE
jgi:serine/threonine-protein kinase